jgi:hypothetical protein
MRHARLAALFAAGAALLVPGLTAKAASHSDAPLIKLDPQANITDVYAFIRNRPTDGKKVLNVLVAVRPFANPGDGVMYEKFSNDALYSIHIADPATGATRMRYDFRFSPPESGYKNLDTILSYGLGTEAGPIQNVGDARQNYTQTYMVSRVVGSKTTVIGSGLLCPPPNVGERATPFYNDAQGRPISGATSFAGLDRYTQQTIFNLPSGETVFAGPREDGFYADTPGIFDLLNPRILKTDNRGVDDFKGFNVQVFTIQIPVDQLPLQNSSTIGVYASVSRPRVSLRLSDAAPVNSGPWIQVNRMGNPLFNEVLVALRDKDNYNRTSPLADGAQFKKYAQNPEVAFLINFVVFGDPTGQAPLQTKNRADLVGIYIPDVLRVDTSTGPVPVAGEASFNRLSFLGGDTVHSASQNASIPSGWPNGRRLGDDVVDIALTAVASGPTFQQIIPISDNANANDQPYHTVFPYAATPNSGTSKRHDPEP